MNSWVFETNCIVGVFFGSISSQLHFRWRYCPFVKFCVVKPVSWLHNHDNDVGCSLIVFNGSKMSFNTTIFAQSTGNLYRHLNRKWSCDEIDREKLPQCNSFRKPRIHVFQTYTQEYRPQKNKISFNVQIRII